MPTITLNKKVFEKLAGRTLPVEKLKERISMLGTDLEEVKGNEIIVEVFPNRPDMLSEQGFARAFSSFIGVKTGLRNYPVKRSGIKVIVDRSVHSVRPFTACAVVKGIHFDDEKIREIIQVQEKLHISYGRNRRKVAIGIYPLEAIKPPIRYLARKPNDIRFMPLESSREMSGTQILSQHPAGREYGHLLEGMVKFPVFMDANNRIMSMPPVINSHDTGKITAATKDLFIECSGFEFHPVSKCLNMIVSTLADMGGQIYSVDLKYPNKGYTTPELEPSKMRIDLEYVNKILGLKLKESDLKMLLSRTGYGYTKKTALVPAYRADVLHQIDLVEDIAIAYGYENFEEIIPKVATIGEESPFEVFKNRIRNILAGLGLIEVRTYTLTNKDFQSTRMKTETKVVELANSRTTEYNSLRSWVIPCLLEVLKNNLHNEYPQNIFDIGHTFQPSDNTETGVEEADRVGIALCSDDVDFTKIKQVLDYLMNSLALKYETEDTEHKSFIEGRVGRVMVNERKVAYIGEVHPEVLSNWQLETPVAAIELNLTDLFSVM